jgi:type I restriction enzyme S subunit
MKADLNLTFYREEKFKETPIGKIPEDWEVVKIGERKISKLVKSGSTPSKKRVDYWNGKIPFVTIGDMTKVEKYIYNTQNKITEVALRESNIYLLPKDSILLSMYGTIGKVAINKVPVTISQNIAGIILNEGVDEEFLYYVLQKYSSQFKYAKIITLKHLDIKMVKNTKIPFVSFPEQKAIAHILSTVNEAIQKTNEIIAKTERLKKGLMQELLTKGIGHKEFKDTEIGRIPKEWDLAYLGIALQYNASKNPRSNIPISVRAQL